MKTIQKHREDNSLNSVIIIFTFFIKKSFKNKKPVNTRLYLYFNKFKTLLK
jgi:hypothetical protein